MKRHIIKSIPTKFQTFKNIIGESCLTRYLSFIILSIFLVGCHKTADNYTSVFSDQTMWKTDNIRCLPGNNGSAVIMSIDDTGGAFTHEIEIKDKVPLQMIISFQYRALKGTNIEMFDFAWMAYDEEGKQLPLINNYQKLPFVADTWGIATFSVSLPSEAEKFVLRYQPPKKQDGRYAVSYLELQDITVSSDLKIDEKDRQSADAFKEAVAEKQWPDEPLRGINIYAYHNNVPSEELFATLKKWNVNVIRLFINVDKGSLWEAKEGVTAPQVPSDAPMAPYAYNMEGLRVTLALARKYQIFVIPVANSVVGRGYDDNVADEEVDSKNITDAEMNEEKWDAYVRGISDIWEYIARNYGDNPWLLAYDLLNEPHTSKEVELWHSEMVPEIVDRIRAIDQNTWIVVEPSPWALANRAFPATLVPISDRKSVYSFHFYMPSTFTHQGVKNKGELGGIYPGMHSRWLGGKTEFWDKARLEDEMKEVIAFQEKYQVKIYVGEFSAVRWAPDAARWIEDVIDIFEKHQWSWTFHSYGSPWNGWNPTFDANDPVSDAPDGGKMTDSLKVLIKAWAENDK